MVWDLFVFLIISIAWPLSSAHIFALAEVGNGVIKDLPGKDKGSLRFEHH